MHRILLGNYAKPVWQMQHRFNPHIKGVVQKEVVKLLEVGIIFPV